MNPEFWHNKNVSLPAICVICRKGFAKFPDKQPCPRCKRVDVHWKCFEENKNVCPICLLPPIVIKLRKMSELLGMEVG